MPIDTSDPAALALEINRAEDFRRKHTAETRKIIERYIGSHYRNDNQSEPTPENLIANYVAFMLPELSFTVPSVKVKALRPVSHQEIAQFMEMGITSWIGSSSLGDEHGDVIRDMLMGYGVMKVGMEPRDSYLETDHANYGRLTPFVCRVPPDHLILDPQCEIPCLARFIGDCYWRDLQALVEHPERWDPQAVEKLQSWGTMEGQTESGYDGRERAVKMGTSGPRKRVMLVDIWIQDTGELITLAKGDGADCQDIILRRGKYEGPKTGPYEIFGAYRVAGDPYPISPLQFSMQQFEEMQTHINATSKAASTWKRWIGVEAAATDAQNAVMTVENGGVAAIRGLSGGIMQQFEQGGPNAEQMQYVNILRDRFDRVLGLGDAQRGRAAGVTATEADDVQQNVDARTDWVRQKATQSTGRVLEKVGWYLFYNPNVAIEVSRVDDVSGQMMEGLFIGGIQPGQEDYDWMAFNLTIMAGSMKRPDAGAEMAKAMQLLQIGPQAVQIMMQMPMLNMRFILNQLGDAMDIENLADILINQQVLAQFGQLRQQQAMYGGAGDPGQMPGNLNPLLMQTMAQGPNASGGGWMPRPQANPTAQLGMPPQPGMGGGMTRPDIGGPGPMMNRQKPQRRPAAAAA